MRFVLVFLAAGTIIAGTARLVDAIADTPPPTSGTVQVETFAATVVVAERYRVDENGNHWYLSDSLALGGAWYDAWAVRDASGQVVPELSGVYISVPPHLPVRDPLLEIDPLSLHEVDGIVVVKDAAGRVHSVP